MQRFFFGILGILLSYLIVRYRAQIGGIIGPIGFAEDKLGSGGTYTLLVFMGIAIFILSLMYMTGSLDTFFQQSVNPYFGEGQPGVQ